MTKTTKE